MSDYFFTRAHLKFDADLNRVVEELASKIAKGVAGAASCDKIVAEMDEPTFIEFLNLIMAEYNRRKRKNDSKEILVAGVA